MGMRTVTRKTAMNTAHKLAAECHTNLREFAISGRVKSDAHRAALMEEVNDAIGVPGSLGLALNDKAFALWRFFKRTRLA